MNIIYSLRITIALTAAVCGVGEARAVEDLSLLNINGRASATPNDLMLLDGQLKERSSAFSKAISSSDNFSGSFKFALTPTGVSPGAGLAFVIQNDPAAGAFLDQYSAGTLAFDRQVGTFGLQNAIGVGFQASNINRAAIFDTTKSVNGVTGLDASTTPLQNFPLLSQLDPNFPVFHRLQRADVSVIFKYSSSDHIFFYSATDSDTGVIVSDLYAVDLSTFGPQLYLGFTGSSAPNNSLNADVTDFVLSASLPSAAATTAAAAVAEPSTWALLLMSVAFFGLFARGRRENGAQTKISAQSLV